MSSEIIECGKRIYTFDVRVTKGGHKYLMITERGNKTSKIMVFHDHFDVFKDALEKAMKSEPVQI